MGATGLRVDHLAYPSFDAGETYRFYSDIMGFALIAAGRGRSAEWGNRSFLYAVFELGHGAYIDFFELDGVKRPKDDGLPRDIRHLALSVESSEDLRGWPRARDAGGAERALEVLREWIAAHGQRTVP